MTDTINRPDPAHTFKVGDDLPDLDMEMRYLVESSAGHKTEPMSAEQCLAFLGVVPEVTLLRRAGRPRGRRVGYLALLIPAGHKASART